MVPPCSIASVLRYTDPGLTNQLPETLREEINNRGGSELLDWLLQPANSPTNDHQKLELSGLWKSHIYPVVNMDMSTEAFFSELNITPNVNRSKANLLNNQFKMMFYREFFKKEQKMANTFVRFQCQ